MPPSGWENATIDGPPNKRLTFVTGKGGVGKTTVAYALGLAAAAAGRRVVVCEIASQERGSRIFGRGTIGFEEVRVAKGLWAISIDPERAGREYLEVQMPMRSMAAVLSRSSIFNYLAAATPGLQEMVTMGKIWELALDDRKSRESERIYDQVIVDAPATGHAIALLQTPASFRDLAATGPIAAQAARIERTLADHDQTGVVIVARGEEMAVNEAISLVESLGGEQAGTTRYEVDAVIVNALAPQRFGAAEVKLLGERADGDLPAAARGAIEAALAEARRATVQREQLERLRAAASGPIMTLPLLFEPELGPAELNRLAKELG